MKAKAFIHSQRAIVLATIAAIFLTTLVVWPLFTAWIAHHAEMEAVREAQWREQLAEAECQCSVARIAACIRSYVRTFGGLPPACRVDDSGIPVHSWRALVQLTNPPGSNDFEDRYSLATPWNSSENLPLLYHEEGNHMACAANSEAVEARYTSYVAVIGETTLWPGSEGRTDEELEGNEDRILFIEIPHTDIPWLEPRDITLDDALQMYTEWHGFRHANHPTGLYYATLDGQIHRFSEIRDRQEFARLLQIRPVDNTP
ncbi:MAG: hypothetical protein U1E05_19640 [Patescibacteria group bacterium]|nr:hypothetical protein [Patescibacteria group bacterium]